MEVVVSHVGTDFDALAAMVACSKVHPGAKILLTGMVRNNVHQFISLHKDSLSLYRPGQLDLERCTVLYMVDAADCSRLGDLSGLCQRAQQVVVYDHHPVTEKTDRPGIQEELGAATTILVEQLQKQQFTLDSFAATLFLLGIYEDTNCLTTTSTTPRDVRAAAWLLEQGARLREVGKYINLPFSQEQRELFEQMLAASTTRDINSRTVLITRAATDEYIGGLGRLTQRLAELEACDLIVCIVGMAERVHLVARSMLPELNLTDLLSPLGVRGHPGAVSATFKGAEPDELLTQVVSALEKSLAAGKLAQDLMSAPVKTVADNTSIREANRLLLRYGHTGMPVMDKNQRLAGIISRRDVDKAMRHELGHAPVRGYMTKNVVTVGPRATLSEMTRLIIQNEIGRLPVLDKGQLVGIITRSDLLRQIHGDSTARWHRPLFSSKDFRLAERQENITGLINARLPKRIQGLLLLLGQKAVKEGFKAYVVGGFVRDLVLGVPNFDLDVVVENNAINFARTLPPLIGGRLHVHEEFGTAKLVLGDGYEIDFATARMEFYQFPAAAPEVEQTTIRHDLYRRDFTINTMGFCLNSNQFGRFLDFFGGYEDLQAGLVRVLYNLSFVEDPTRILRAIRFVGRYDFALEEQTEAFMASAISDNMLARAAAARLGHECRHLFQEENVPALLAMFREYGVLAGLLPGLEWTEQLQRQLVAAAKVIQWNQSQGEIVATDNWQIYPLLLLKELVAERGENAPRLGLKGKEIPALLSVCDKLNPLSSALGEEQLAPSEIYRLLQPLPLVGLLTLLAANPDDKRVRSRVLLYLEDLADMELAISGHDLINLGCEPGPRLGRLLDSVRQARLDGEVESREEQLALAEKLLREVKGELK